MQVWSAKEGLPAMRDQDDRVGLVIVGPQHHGVVDDITIVIFVILKLAHNRIYRTSTAA